MLRITMMAIAHSNGNQPIWLVASDIFFLSTSLWIIFMLRMYQCSFARISIFHPHGVENGDENGESNAENPGKVPHGFFPFRISSAVFYQPDSSKQQYQE